MIAAFVWTPVILAALVLVLGIIKGVRDHRNGGAK